MYRTLIVIVQNQHNYEAYCPDLPGCYALGDTAEEARHNIYDVISARLQDMITSKQAIPFPHSSVEYIDVAFPKVKG